MNLFLIGMRLAAFSLNKLLFFQGCEIHLFSAKNPRSHSSIPGQSNAKKPDGKGNSQYIT